MMDSSISRRGIVAGLAAGFAAAPGQGLIRTAHAQSAPRTFLLIHGAWVGGWYWRRVSDLLQLKGHKVFSPTLTGLGERSHLLSERTAGQGCRNSHDAVFAIREGGGGRSWVAAERPFVGPAADRLPNGSVRTRPSCSAGRCRLGGSVGPALSGSIETRAPPVIPEGTCEPGERVVQLTHELDFPLGRTRF